MHAKELGNALTLGITLRASVRPLEGHSVPVGHKGKLRPLKGLYGLPRASEHISQL